MVLTGRIENGSIVLDGNPSLPEGATVAVTLNPVTSVKPKEGRRVELPLVPSANPGSVAMTSERIAEIMDEEDAAPRH